MDMTVNTISNGTHAQMSPAADGAYIHQELFIGTHMHISIGVNNL